MSTDTVLTPAAQAGTQAAARAVTVAAFRDAMADLGAAVHIVTTDGRAGRAGFTASAVCSVTDSPPSVLVCINRTSSAYAATIANGAVCINTLSADQKPLSAAFSAKASMDERFASGEWSGAPGSAPALRGAIMSIHCRIDSAVQVGTHDILLCEVDRIESNAHAGILIYYNRRYHDIARE
ncbi:MULTISPECIES: flavin reductase [Cupriavidus]|uniref:flavin reductase n=1 Tax=Cupriavidus TaxID=106589 RepID=UPI00035C1432|nr:MULTISPECIES: flavin reductase [Cupriavidus]